MSAAAFGWLLVVAVVAQMHMQTVRPCFVTRTSASSRYLHLFVGLTEQFCPTTCAVVCESPTAVAGLMCQAGLYCTGQVTSLFDKLFMGPV